MDREAFREALLSVMEPPPESRCWGGSYWRVSVVCVNMSVRHESVKPFSGT